MAIKKVVKSSVSQQVFDQLREQILSGSLENPGRSCPQKTSWPPSLGSAG